MSQFWRCVVDVGRFFIGALSFPVCGVHVHFFCGDTAGEEGPVHMRWFLECRQWSMGDDGLADKLTDAVLL